MLEIDRDSDEQNDIPDPTVRLNRILPSNVRHYFLFDGEKIDEFAKPEHEDEVWNAVRNVLKLEIIERGKRHFNDISRSYSKELRDYSSGELEKLLNKEDRYKEKREAKKEKLSKTKEELKECKHQIKKIEERQSEIKEIKDLINKRKDFRQKIKNAEIKLEKAQNKLKGYISKASVIFASDFLNSTQKLLNEVVKENQIPAGTLKKLAQKLINDGTCICGRGIEENSAEKRELVDLITKEGKEEKNEGFLIDLNGDIKSALQKKEDLLENIRDKHSEVRDIEEEREYYEAKENEISSQLTEDKRENIAKLEKRRNNLLEDKGKLQEKIDNLGKNIKEISENIKKVQENIEKEKALEEEMEELKQKKLLAEKSSEALEEIYEKFAEEMRKKIEEEASDIFHKLIRKKQSFSQVALTEDYQLNLIDRFGDKDARSEISAGERQVLSLAFILGLAKVSDGEAPLVIDTPFGRLDSDHRRNIVGNIPELTDQLVLLVTDEELDESNRESLQGYIDKEYTLDYDDEVGNTNIVRDL